MFVLNWEHSLNRDSIKDDINGIPEITRNIPSHKIKTTYHLFLECHKKIRR